MEWLSDGNVLDFDGGMEIVRGLTSNGLGYNGHMVRMTQLRIDAANY